MKLQAHRKYLDLLRVNKHELHQVVKQHITWIEKNEKSTNTLSAWKGWYKNFRLFIYGIDKREFTLNNKGVGRDYQLWLVEAGYANTTVRWNFKMLIAILNRLDIPNSFNTAELFRGYAVTSKANEDYFLTDAEVKMLLAIGGLGAPGVILDRFLICCFTGCRISEVWTVRVENKTTLRYTSSKTKKDILVPYSNPVRPYIESARYLQGLSKAMEHAGKQNEILTGIFKALGWDAPVKTYGLFGKKKIMREVPRYEALTFHSGRKFFGKMLLDRDVPMYKVSQMLGHSSVAITERYYAALSKEKMLIETSELINKF